MFQVMSSLFSIPLGTVNNTKTQENVSVCTGPKYLKSKVRFWWKNWKRLIFIILTVLSNDTVETYQFSFHRHFKIRRLQLCKKCRNGLSSMLFIYLWICYLKPMMDRKRKDDLPKMQVGFIDSIGLPIYEVGVYF